MTSPPSIREEASLDKRQSDRRRALAAGHARCRLYPALRAEQDSTEQQVFTVLGRVDVPLYQGGGVAARIRQAKETNNQLKKEVEDARLRIHAEVVSNWAQLQSTASQIKSAQDALEANRIALEGVKEEEKVGQRTTLDVLNAQLEYLGSQIQLVTAKRDRVVAEYSVYSSIGRRDAQSRVYQCLSTTRLSTTTS